MLSLFQSAYLVFASLLVDPAPPTSVRCVSLADGVLDLRVMADVIDVWSLDANASVGGSKGEVTLYVVSSAPTLTISVLFAKLGDKATITDAQGGVTTLTPATMRDAVTATVPLAVGKPIEFVAVSNGSTPASVPNPKPVGASNKAVIKPVTTCPT
jgi:hypothetical protein